jgi:hypothetical protein
MTTAAKAQPIDLDSIYSLPDDWHGAGSLHRSVLKALASLPAADNSVETGTGKSTLIFSRLSKNHTVFTLDDSSEGNSLNRVRASDQLNAESVSFVVGPTQITLPRHSFSAPLDIALIDGPHGYPFPELEYYCIYPHLKPGAWLIIDDTQIPTIARMIDVIKNDSMFRLDRFVKTTAFVQRTDAPTFPPTRDGWWTQGYNQKHYPVLRHIPLGEWPRWITPRWVKTMLKRLVA